VTHDDYHLVQSTNIMISKLIDEGMIEPMALKLPSQIRKGAPLFDEWKGAFASKRFVQKLGRCTSFHKKARKLRQSKSKVLLDLADQTMQTPGESFEQVYKIIFNFLFSFFFSFYIGPWHHLEL